MKVAVLCEFSGIVRDAFRRRGHDAISFDLLPSESPGPHFVGDYRGFDWDDCDLAIGFPPCTYLALSGARWWKQRPREQEAAIAFVREMLALPVPRLAIENPLGVLSKRIRPPDQIVQPWMFGHPETKATCLWLKNLPRLRPTRLTFALRVGRVHREAPGADRWKRRSRTLAGLAEAMAAQWGGEGCTESTIRSAC